MGDGGETRCLSDGHPGCGRRRRKHEGCLATVQARYTRSASQGVSHSTFGCHIRIGSAISSILRLSTVISPRGDAISSKRDFLLISPEKIINFPSFSYFETCLKKSAQRGRFCPASLEVFIRKQVGRSFSALCSIGQAIGSLLEESGAPSLGQGKGRSGLRRPGRAKCQTTVPSAGLSPHIVAFSKNQTFSSRLMTGLQAGQAALARSLSEHTLSPTEPCHPGRPMPSMVQALRRSMIFAQKRTRP